jgi:DNA repair exonuclease SbcCD ATPase subunit
MFFLIGFFSQAQQEVVVEYGDHKFKDGVRPAFSCVIPETTMDIVERDFKKRVTNITKEKATSEGFEWYYVGIDLKEFRNDTIDVTAGAYSRDEGVLVALGFILDGQPYDFESNSQAKRQVETTVREFAIIAYQEKVKMDLDAEKEKLMSYEKMIKQSHKEEDEAIKGIKTKERKIQSSRDDVSRIQEERRIIENEILDIKEKLIQGSMDPEVKKQEQKRQKDLEGKLRKLEKEQEKLLVGISDLEAEIRDLERQQEEIITKRQEYQAAYNDQKLIVEEVSSKLSGIK